MKNKEKKLYFYEIDFIKSFAIISVILLHILSATCSNKVLFEMWAPFHIWQAVPLFILVFGFTYRLSVEKKYDLLTIVISRLIRLIFPLLVACILSFILLLSFNILPEVDWHIFIGKIPLYGNGVYFITLYLESIFYFSIFYFLVVKYNKNVVIFFSILVSICGELISYYINIDDSYMYSASFHRYILFFILGYYYLYDFLKNNKIYFMTILLGLGGVVLMYKYSLDRAPLWPYSESVSANNWGFQHFPYAIYTLVFSYLLVYVSRVIHRIKVIKIINHKISNATLHIFLLQIFVFTLRKLYSIEINLLSGSLILIFSLMVGILWYEVEDKILKISKLNLKGSK